MADRPIIFSAPMIQALRAGSKTQTRRILKPQPCSVDGDGRWYRMPGGGDSLNCHDLPYAVGDRLWVRENFSDHYSMTGTRISEREPFPGSIWFWADGSPDEGDFEKPRPSIHMPRWASRMTLVLTDVRVQRLKAISFPDMLAEGLVESDEIVGIEPTPSGHPREIYGFRYRVPGVHSDDEGFESEDEAFADLWNRIHGPGAWEASPYVVALTFEVHQKNIDEMEADNG